ncbi:helix-turn-helix domain-containing protein [Nonomuraea sp. 3-1Str]|uniref:TetR/AcrR family transcriptional regulator n=1 Tax=Nonomuraea sp. 3-1Str TaxID=2929801 RepID=UPI0028708B18|nr:helix-turn-helix domain-containing protein [Nonomuraea sp. 3-1Str]
MSWQSMYDTSQCAPSASRPPRRACQTDTFTTRRPRADARRNYERLLAEADAAFREGGVESSLESVARRAGVAIGTLYGHFPTRRALVRGHHGLSPRRVPPAHSMPCYRRPERLGAIGRTAGVWGSGDPQGRGVGACPHRALPGAPWREAPLAEDRALCPGASQPEARLSRSRGPRGGGCR